MDRETRRCPAFRKLNNFAEGSRLQDFLTGAASLCKRQLLPGDRQKGAILQPGEESGIDLLFFGFGDAQNVKS
jgi:hypothetical protein